MLRRGLRDLWAEPRPLPAPVRTWLDWVLVGVLVSWSVVEVVLRDDSAWRPVVLIASVVVAASLLWRRTDPLAATVAAFGTLTVVDVARIFTPDETTLLFSVAGVLLLPYSVFRWGAGREAVIGLGPILVWLVVTHIADPVGAGEVAAAFGFFLFSAALGASMRYYARARNREIEQARLRERIDIARELHDTVGHHVSAIAIQAQAGRVLAASQPERALATLETIEAAASRALEEMRAMLGLMREGSELVRSPQHGVRDIHDLAQHDGSWPRVDVEFSGRLDTLPPSVGAALYRVATEAVNNAARHARNATRVVVLVADEGKQVRLTVHDDGESPMAQRSQGYGLVGMTERVTLLGGTFHAGPDPDGGWMVDAVLPKGAAIR